MLFFLAKIYILGFIHVNEDRIFIPGFHFSFSDKNIFSIPMHESYTNQLGFFWAVHLSLKITILQDLHNKTLLIPKWLHQFTFYSSVYDGPGPMLCMWVLSDYSPLSLIRAPFYSKLLLLRCSPILGTTNKSAHIALLRTVETFLRIWVGKRVFQYSTLNTLHPSQFISRPSKLSSQPHQREDLVLFCFNLFVDFIFQQLPSYSFSFLHLRTPCISSCVMLTFNDCC